MVNFNENKASCNIANCILTLSFSFSFFLFQAHDCQCQYHSCGEDDGRHLNVSPWKRPRRQINDSDDSFCFCQQEFYGTTMYFFTDFLIVYMQYSTSLSNCKYINVFDRIGTIVQE